MARYGRDSDFTGAEFVGVDLTGARFTASEVTDVVVRGSELRRVELDSPWLTEGENFLLVNGVDVIPLVDAELDRRFPGRELRRSEDPEGLRAAWAALEQTWQRTLDRVAAMPAGTPEVSVGGEWSFAQTLRHLVLATDTWLGRAVLGEERGYHPLGLANPEAESDGLDMSQFSAEHPSYDEVLAARADRQAKVRAHLGSITADDLSVERRNPWAPDYPESTLACLQTILEEEWEHHRYAVRDLDAIERRPEPSDEQVATTAP